MSTRKRWRNIKIKIESIIENIDTKEKNVYNLEGTKENNKLEYKDDIFKNTIIIDDVITLIRESDEVKYVLEFNKYKQTESKYTLKEYNSTLNIIIVTNIIEITKNSLKIEYIQNINDENNNFCYKLRWEEKNEEEIRRNN